jgi:hypothetical protein
LLYLCFLVLTPLNLIVSWERNLSNWSAYRFNEILRFWLFLLDHGLTTLIRT